MFGLGFQELLLILVIILIFFGADKIPQLAKSLGKGMSEFRKAQQDLKEEIAGEVVPEPVPGSAATSEAVELKPTYIVCPACHGKTVANSLYCASCGKPMTQQPVCSVCQRPFMENEKFCPNCGQPHVENNA